jgi:hypothetical protein
VVPNLGNQPVPNWEILQSALAEMLSAQMGLSMSPEKTLVTPVTGTMRFLGHHLRVRRHPRDRHLHPRLVIPKDRSKRLRRSIALIFERSTITETLESRLQRVNPILRGWANFYRHAWGAKRVFTGIDNYLWWTIKRWLRKKHPDTRMDKLVAQYGWHKPRQKALRWRDGDTVPVALAAIRVAPYYPGGDRGPHYA